MRGILYRKYANGLSLPAWSSLLDSLVKAGQDYQSNSQGLMDSRKSRGFDPNTGISDAEKARIWETYNRIQDPAQKAAYIKAQDPGNLVPQLIDARNKSRAPDNQIYLNQAPEILYDSPSRYGGGDAPGQVKLTISPQLYTDPATGREVAFSAPTNIEYIAPQKDKLSKDMNRVGGGIMGAMLGFATGGIGGAFAGAYFGAGGPTSNFSFKHPGNIGKFHGNTGGPMTPKQVGTALAFAAFTGGGVFGEGTDTGYIVH